MLTLYALGWSLLHGGPPLRTAYIFVPCTTLIMTIVSIIIISTTCNTAHSFLSFLEVHLLSREEAGSQGLCYPEATNWHPRFEGVLRQSLRPASHGLLSQFGLDLWKGGGMLLCNYGMHKDRSTSSLTYYTLYKLCTNSYQLLYNNYLHTCTNTIVLTSGILAALSWAILRLTGFSLGAKVSLWSEGSGTFFLASSNRCTTGTEFRVLLEASFKLYSFRRGRNVKSFSKSQTIRLWRGLSGFRDLLRVWLKPAWDFDINWQVWAWLELLWRLVFGSVYIVTWLDSWSLTHSLVWWMSGVEAHRGASCSK